MVTVADYTHRRVVRLPTEADHCRRLGLGLVGRHRCPVPQSGGEITRCSGMKGYTGGSGGLYLGVGVYEHTVGHFSCPFPQMEVVRLLPPTRLIETDRFKLSLFTMSIGCEQVGFKLLLFDISDIIASCKWNRLYRSFISSNSDVNICCKSLTSIPVTQFPLVVEDKITDTLWRLFASHLANSATGVATGALVRSTELSLVCL